MTYVYPLPIAANTNDPTQTYHVKGATDLLAPSGTPIGSVTEGTVISAGWDTLGGNTVLMRGLDGLTYYFAHMRDAPLVRAGDKVSAGQLLGYVGDTGNAKGGPTHLHIGIGHGIAEGAGAAGGAGIGFDAQAFLHSLKAGGAGIAATATAAVDPTTILGDVGGAIGDGAKAAVGAVGSGATTAVGALGAVPGMSGLGVGLTLAGLLAKAFGYDPGQISEQTIMDILILVIAIGAVLAGLWGIANSSGATKVALDVAKVVAA